MFRWILAAAAVFALSVAISLAYEQWSGFTREPPAAFASAPGVRQEDIGDYQAVSLVRLLGSPDQYDGRKVRVQGYVVLGLEGMAVHLDRDAYEAALWKNAIRLDPPKWLPPANERRLTLEYAEVAGVFRAADHGHRGIYSGTLTEIRDIREIFTQTAFEDLRVHSMHEAVLGQVLTPWFLTLIGWAGLAIFWLGRRLAK